MRLIDKINAFSDGTRRNDSQILGDDNVVTIGHMVVTTDTLMSIPGLNISIEGNGNRISLAESIHITGVLHIRVGGNNNTTTVSEDVFVGNDMAIVFFKGGPDTEADNCKVSIGRGTKFTGECISLALGEANTTIDIGHNCLVAGRVRFVTSDNHGIFDIETRNRVNIPGDVKVGDDCWLCEDVIMLNNTEIPRGCVVGIRSVVTKRFTKAQCVIAGIPASVRRENIKWSENTKIGNVNWPHVESACLSKA